ncbi:MAG: hypothetical protein BMS9Abin06_0111 [Gammaproteobacteria bacterium]|nr:MAG: hypothetical protein BMS9Abin06_0111 [Gammaproteobacteria bacterium]
MGFEDLDMTINIVVADSAELPESVGFPPLETVKYRISNAIDHYIRNFENKGVTL